MADKLSLYNGALRVLKQRKLSSLTDNVPARHQLDGVFDESVQACLEEGFWNFATRSVEIEPLTDVAANFGYDHVYEQPEDFVRLVAISADATLRPGLDDYRIETGYILANVNPLYLAYISNDANYGLNYGIWPMTFQRFVHHDLAMEVGPHLTKMSERERSMLHKMHNMAKRNARSKDALNQAPMTPDPGRLVRARVSRQMDQRRSSSQ